MQMSNKNKWLLVVSYSIFILATLPVARSAWNWIGVSNGKIILVGLYIGALGYTFAKLRNYIILFTILFLSVLVFRFIDIPAERIHFIEYGILGWMAYWAAGNNMRGLFIALGYIVIMGVLDEVVQWILPDRYFDMRDIGMNIFGGVIGILLAVYYYKRTVMPKPKLDKRIYN